MNTSEILLAKSIESVTLAIELYNKPLIKYRTESVVILLVNSWENLLKALIRKKKWAKIYDKKTDSSKPFDECLECVKSNLGKAYSSDWYESTKILYKERCKIIHYHKGLALVDYSIIQANILFLKDFVQTHFNKSIVKDKNWYVLPIASEIPFTDFDFIKHTSSLRKISPEIKNYIEKVVKIHDQQTNVPSGKGVLMNVRVSLENVSRIKNADVVTGVDNQGGKTKVLIEQNIKLSNTGKEIQIKEFKEKLEKYKYHHRDILKTSGKIQGHTQKAFNAFMKKIRDNPAIAFNWANFSPIFPMKISDKYTYTEDILEEYEKYLRNNP